MLEYPREYDAVLKAFAPYYHQKRPLDFFFEMYILSTLDELPPETTAALHEFSAKHPTLFRKYNGDWQAFVVNELHLSRTIDVAIWDLWIKNRATSQARGDDYHPWQYARDFAEQYVKEGSLVDVWSGTQLEDAKKRIEAHRRMRS